MCGDTTGSACPARPRAAVELAEYRSLEPLIHSDEAELLAGLEQLEKALRPVIGAQSDLNVPLCLRVMALAVTAWRSAGQVSRRAGSRSGPEPARMLTVIGRSHLEAH